VTSKLPMYPSDLLHLAPGVELDVGVLVRLDHARGEDALRAVECGERLAQLAHVAADGRLLLDEDDLVASVGDVERRLDAAMPPPMTMARLVTGILMTSSGLLCLTFSTIVRPMSMALAVASSMSSWIQEQCSRMLAISHMNL